MFVNVAIGDFADLMNYVEPEYRFTCDYSEDGLEIEFEMEDGVKALQWIYSHYNFHIYAKHKGQVKCCADIFYDEDTDSYGWMCFINDAKNTGYASPDEAEEAANVYLDELSKED